MSTPIRVAIFDLDDTLYDCFNQRVLAAHRCAAEAMSKAGVPATAEEIFEARMQAYAADPRMKWIEAAVCRQFGVAEVEHVARAARDAFFSMPVGPLTLFPGALRTLRTLAAWGVRIFVVTFGDPKIQRDKVEALGLDRETVIEHVYYADTLNVVTKEEVFGLILRETGVDPAEVLVVGDRPDREIRAAKRLGMRTARMRGGEFSGLQLQAPDERADYEIAHIEDLLTLPLEFGSSYRPTQTGHAGKADAR